MSLSPIFGLNSWWALNQTHLWCVHTTVKRGHKKDRRTDHLCQFFFVILAENGSALRPVGPTWKIQRVKWCSSKCFQPWMNLYVVFFWHEGSIKWIFLADFWQENWHDICGTCLQGSFCLLSFISLGSSTSSEWRDQEVIYVFTYWVTFFD